jgi:hypothetical protein
LPFASIGGPEAADSMLPCTLPQRSIFAPPDTFPSFCGVEREPRIAAIEGARPGQTLVKEPLDECIPREFEVHRDVCQDSSKGADAEHTVRGNGHVVLALLLRREPHVAPRLPGDDVAQPTERTRERRSTKVA